MNRQEEATKRNIRQVEENGINPKKYFVDKTKEELIELYNELDKWEEGDKLSLETIKEMADVINCVNDYLPELFSEVGEHGLYEERLYKKDIAFKRLGGWEIKK